MEITPPRLTDQFSFSQFVFKANRRNLQIGLIAGLIQILIFKTLYPFPDFISDSYSYMETNLYHMNVNLWPVGYSIFISWIHAISASHYFLVFVQFWILQAALYYFFFTVLYLYQIKNRNANLLFIFLFFNPIFLYLANCVLSDAIFCALSLVLFVQYLWMFHKPRYYHIIIQAVLIGVLFVIRYTAIYYPIISIVAILLATYRPAVKLGGMILPWIFIGSFILYTQQQTKELTGTPEFSVFGGWQIANNSLYMYGHINVDSTKLPKDTRELNRWAMEYFNHVQPTEEDFREIEGTFFMKMPNAILKPYLRAHLDSSRHNDPTGFKSWGKVSPIYNKYGRYLIQHYPIPFARYYLWLNTKNYFFPYLEKFGYYNLGEDRVWDAAVIWFKLEHHAINKIPSTYFQGYIFFMYPFLFMFLNLYFVLVFVYFLIEKKWEVTPRFSNISILLAATFLAVNFGFSIFATPVVLRYQIVPMILLVFFSIYLTERIFGKQPAPAQ